MLIGVLMLSVNMAIQILAAVAVIRYFIRRISLASRQPSLRSDSVAIGTVALVFLIGHLLQSASWAVLFVWLGEFSAFDSAFYHSMVNFTSLGYGDIVMSEQWRLLGALEAANGLLMFSLTAGGLLALMSKLFNRLPGVVDARSETASRS
jgi:hypothetical protein